MHRVDGANPGPGNSFVEGDDIAGTPATQVTGAILTTVQEELAAVCERAGLTLSKPNNAQLWEAIGLMFNGRWALKNLIINGDGAINQRGIQAATFTGAARYQVDRWLLFPGGASGASYFTSIFAAGAKLDATRSRRACRWQQSVAGSGGTPPSVAQRLEFVETLAGTKVTVSFWASLTNLSSGTTLTLTPKFVQYFGASGSAAVTTTCPNIVVTNNGAFARFSSTFTVPSIAGKSYFFTEPTYVELRLEATQGVTFTLELHAIQLEIGTQPSDFELRPIGLELLLAQRYFETSYPIDAYTLAPFPPGTATYQGASVGYDVGLTANTLKTRFFVPKRAVPTMVWYSPNSGAVGNIHWNGADDVVTGVINTSIVSTGAPQVTPTVPASNCFGHWTADAEL